MRASRRSFLKALAASAAGAPLVAQLGRIEDAFAMSISETGLRPHDPASIQDLRASYLLADDLVYLNHASIGTMPRAVHQARLEYALLCESNPWLYMWGGEWDPPREEARRGAAEVLGSTEERVAITHNTTEGFNILAQGLPLGPGDEVLFSTLNHDGASVCWSHMAEARGFDVRRFDFPIEDTPGLSPEDVLQLHLREITDRTKVLVFPHVDNMVGIRHPMEELAREAHRLGVEFVAADGAQTAGMIPLSLADSEIDFYAASPHKWIQSPKGLGLLHVREAVQDAVRPMWVTWGLRRWAGTVRVLEDYGTRNLPETLALGDAADFQIRLGASRKEERLVSLWTRMKDRVDASPRLEWRSPPTWNGGASLVAVEVAGQAAGQLGDLLYREHRTVLRAFGTDRLNALRVAPNVITSDEEIDRFFDLLESL